MQHLFAGLGLLIAVAVLAFQFEGGDISLSTGEVHSEEEVVAAEARPEDYVAFTSRQWGTRDTVAVTSGPGHVWISDVLQGYQRTVVSGAPVLGETLATNGTCRVVRYDGVARVLPIMVTETGREIGVSTQPLATLNDGAETLIENYSRSGYRGGLPGVGRKLELIDVVVPASEDPVHLALMVGKGTNIAFSFHLAPGAKVAGVTVIGGTGVGFIGLPSDARVEIIPAPVLQDCGLRVMVQDYYEVGAEGRLQAHDVSSILPAVQQDRPVDQGLPSTAAELQALIDSSPTDSFRHWKASFELWFLGEFGINPRVGIAGYSEVQVVVAGNPAGQPAVPWRGPGGRVMDVAGGMVYLAGSASERSTRWRELIVARAEAIIGAPLETIHPDNRPEDTSVAARPDPAPQDSESVAEGASSLGGIMDVGRGIAGMFRDP